MTEEELRKRFNNLKTEPTNVPTTGDDALRERFRNLTQPTTTPAQPTTTPTIAPTVTPVQTPTQQPTSQPAPQVAPVQSAARNEFAQFLREQGNNDTVINTLLNNMTDKDVENELAKVKRTPVQKAAETAPVAQNNSAYSNLPSHEMTNVDRATRALGNIGGTIGTATVSGSAKALNVAKRADDWLTGNDSTAIDPQKLLAYANGNHGILEDRDMTILWNLANERQDNLRVLYNRLYYNDPTLTADKIKDYLNKSQKHVEESDYMKWVEPSERKFEQQQKTNIENYNPGYANALNTVGNIAEVAAPTTLAAVAKVPTPVTFGAGGAITGENKMQQYLEQGKSYEEARKEIPIETAKGVAFGAALKVLQPVMSLGITPEMPTLVKAGIALVDGTVAGAGAATASQLIDALKDDPDFDYINWQHVEQGIQSGKYNTLDDYLNSQEFQNDVYSNRGSQIILAGLATGIFNAGGQVINGISQSRVTKAQQNTLKSEANEYLRRLGLKEGATQEQVKAAYRQLSRTLHPDINPNGAEEFTKVNEAYNALTKNPKYAFVFGKGVTPVAQQPAQTTQNATPQQQALIPQTASSLANAPQPEAVGVANAAIQNAAPSTNIVTQTTPTEAKTPEPPDNMKVRKHVETIANAPGTPKEVAKDIRNDARKYYVPQSNEETMENARAIIGEDIEKAERTFLQRESLETAEDVAVADLLMQDAVSKGDYKRADELAIALSQKFTKAGQVMQAANIIKNLSPSGMLVYAEKELDNATRTIKKDNPNFYKKLKEQGIISKNDSGVEKIQLTDEEKKQIVDNMQKAEGMPDGREKDILIAKTMKLIGDKIPATALEKVAALRRNGLLTNFKTLNRNLGSNGGFGILEMIKDVPATIIDSITSLFTGKRTTRLPNIGAAVKGFGKGFSEAVQDLWYGIDTTDGTEGKYGKLKKTFKREDTWKDIWNTFKAGKGKEAAKKVFNRLLSDYEDTAGFLVNGTDRPFWNARFESELANQMKLGGLKYGEDLPTDEMKEIAKESADYATFKNKNALSSSLSQLRNTLNFKKPIGAADAIGLTFTNVPGSVGSKISDYTIGGATKVLKEIYNAATKNGKFNQRKFVDYLGRVITGTGAIALLVPLIKNKILTGSYDDDKDKADIEREMGIQQNSINLTALKRLIEGKDTKLQEGDKFYNFDWLQPVSGLAILGTNLYNKATQGSEQVSEGGTSKLDDENEYYIKKTDDTNIGDVALEGLRTVANQVADMSSLGNFADLFRGYEGLGGNIIDIPGNFASSFIPTLSNNLGQYTDETARNTKDYTSRIKTNINKLKNKIPGVRETLTPKVTTTGEEKKQYVDGNDFISTFINPGYMTTYNPTDVQKELQSVYEDTGDKTIYPGVAPSGITYNKERVTLKPKGVETYQKASGKYASEVYDALFDNEFYKSLEPESKAKVLKQIADDSREVGKAAIGIETNNYFKLDTKREELDKGSLSLADYYLYASQLKGITSKNTKKTYIANITNSINNKEGKDYIDKKDKEILYDIFGVN